MSTVTASRCETRLSPRVIVENTEADKDNISSHLSSVVLDSDGEYAERCDCAAAAPHAHMELVNEIENRQSAASGIETIDEDAETEAMYSESELATGINLACKQETSMSSCDVEIVEG
jgi:hypothetical protein